MNIDPELKKCVFSPVKQKVRMNGLELQDPVSNMVINHQRCYLLSYQKDMSTKTWQLMHFLLVMGGTNPSFERLYTSHEKDKWMDGCYAGEDGVLEEKSGIYKNLFSFLRGKKGCRFQVGVQEKTISDTK